MTWKWGQIGTEKPKATHWNWEIYPQHHFQGVTKHKKYLYVYMHGCVLYEISFMYTYLYIMYIYIFIYIASTEHLPKRPGLHDKLRMKNIFRIDLFMLTINNEANASSAASGRCHLKSSATKMEQQEWNQIYTYTHLHIHIYVYLTIIIIRKNIFWMPFMARKQERCEAAQTRRKSERVA